MSHHDMQSCGARKRCCLLEPSPVLTLPITLCTHQSLHSCSYLFSMQHDQAGTVSRSCKAVILDTVQVIGWENIELISDRPLETMLDEFKRLKQEYPDRRAFLMHKCSM